MYLVSIVVYVGKRHDSSMKVRLPDDAKRPQVSRSFLLHSEAPNGFTRDSSEQAQLRLLASQPASQASCFPKIYTLPVSFSAVSRCRCRYRCFFHLPSSQLAPPPVLPTYLPLYLILEAITPSKRIPLVCARPHVTLGGACERASERASLHPASPPYTVQSS